MAKNYIKIKMSYQLISTIIKIDVKFHLTLGTFWLPHEGYGFKLFVNRE